MMNTMENRQYSNEFNNIWDSGSADADMLLLVRPNPAHKKATRHLFNVIKIGAIAASALASRPHYG